MIALFSRSGSVLVEVLQNLPGGGELSIFSNNSDTETWDPRLVQESYKDYVTILSHKEIEEHLRIVEPTKIFLFGYLRILSADICERHEIYNLHPADIVTRPDLKGKDPLERYFEGYTKPIGIRTPLHWLGNVIHKVIPEVDEGPILSREIYFARDYDEAVKKSRTLAIEMWVEFITKNQ